MVAVALAGRGWPTAGPVTGPPSGASHRCAVLATAPAASGRRTALLRACLAVASAATVVVGPGIRWGATSTTASATPARKMVLVNESLIASAPWRTRNRWAAGSPAARAVPWPDGG